MAIVPTVGRVVLFRPGRLDGLCSGEPEQRLAAIVCAVLKEGRVNLRVFDGNGNGYGRMLVKLRQPEEEVDPEDGYCEWMQYQLGQAAKTEAAEKALEAAQKASAPKGK